MTPSSPHLTPTLMASAALEALEQCIATLDMSGPLEELLALDVATNALKDRAKELRQKFDARRLEWVETNGGFEAFDRWWSIYCPVKYGAVDRGTTLVALFAVIDGDVEGLGEFLYPQPFRIGACKAVLPNFSDHFTSERQDPTVTGKPVHNPTNRR